MDQEMPVKDGIEATRELRGQHYMMPIIAITGDATMETQSRCYAAGMNSFLTKPVDVDKLLNEIASLPHWQSLIKSTER
jgi:CheY-like chemotaxis protein